MMKTDAELPMMPPPVVRLLYTREQFSFGEAAQILALSTATLRRDERLGKIRTKCWGRRKLIPRHEVERLLAEGMTIRPGELALLKKGVLTSRKAAQTK
jgi:hypothetical protein